MSLRFAAPFVAVLILSLSSCAVGRGNPDQLLSRATTNWSQADRISFTASSQMSTAGLTMPQGRRFQGYVLQGSKLYLRAADIPTLPYSTLPVEETTRMKQQAAGGWIGIDPKDALLKNGWNGSPIEQMALVRDAKRSVSLDTERSDGRTDVLVVELDPAKTTAQWKRKLLAQFASAVSPAGAPLSGPDRAQLDEMLRTLRASSTATLAVDRDKNTVSGMRLRHVLTYRLGGKERKETRVWSYRFGASDANAPLPSS